MNRLFKILVSFLALSLGTVRASEQQVQDFALDDHMVYSVPVSVMRVTTISFPSPVSAIDGALITADGKTPGLFQIAHTNGTAYLSVRALAKGAVTNLNVRWSDRTYVFELRESEQACYSVILRSETDRNNGVSRPLTPNRLLGLLDEAKAFALIKQYHPEEVQDVDYTDLRAKPGVSDCGDFQIDLLEAFRFPIEDTLIFHLTVSNKGDKPLQHSPERLQVRIGDQVFTPSVADLSALIAPHGTVSGYIAVTGTPTGGRNDLSLKNDFSFVLARFDPKVEAAVRDFDALQTKGFEK
jgi:hypothetical protein